MVVDKVQLFCYGRKEKKKENTVDGGDYVINEKEKNNDNVIAMMVSVNKNIKPIKEDSNYNDMKINPLHAFISDKKNY